MHLPSITLLNAILGLGVVSGLPSAPCNQNGGIAYYCQDSSFYVCQTSTNKWLLQNVCDGDCCDIPAYAAYCPNCASRPMTTTTKTKTTSIKTSSKTTKPKPTSTKTKTSAVKPDPTLAPGAICDTEGNYGCSGSNFLICHDDEWLLQNVCDGDCCSVPAFAAYCYNCGDGQITTKPKPTSTKTSSKTTKPKPTSTKTKTTAVKPDPTLAPGAICDTEGNYGCSGSNFLICHDDEWLLQNVCDGDCCSVPAFAAYCYNCGDSQTTTKPKPTSTKTSSKTTKPKPTSTKTKTTSIKPDPTVAPGAQCGTEGSFGCSGSNFLVCQHGEWELQNVCGDYCCNVPQYAQYCYNC